MKAQSLHPPYLSCLSNNSKSSTHQGEDITSSKPKTKSNAKANKHPFNGIYNFGLDNDGNIAKKPNQETQGPLMDDVYDFGSFDNSLKLDFMGGSNNGMEIDVVEPVGSSKPKAVKKVVASGSGLAKSRNKGGGKLVRTSEKEKEVAKLMVKGKALMGIEEQIYRQVTLKG